MKNPVPPCPTCASDNVKRAGYSRYGKQRFQCRACRYSFCLDPQTRLPIHSGRPNSWLLAKSVCLSAAWPACSASAVTLLPSGSKKASLFPPLKKTLVKTKKGIVLELDEMQHWLSGGWSFVFRRKNKRWIWLAQCRRTR